jgi:hypothetical protein
MNHHRRLAGHPGVIAAAVAAVYFLVHPAGAAAGVSEDQMGLLREAERARGDLGGRGIVWIVDAISEEKGETETMRLRVVTQNDSVYAEVLEPEKSQGTKYLVVDGKMWFHKPNLSRPVSVSRRQRVVGRAAVGDIAAMSFLKDYSVESAEDGEVEGEACHVFTLKEKTRDANYPLIRYWVSKERRLGLRAVFFTVSGSQLRTATMRYGHELTIDGEKRRFLSEMKVEEQLGSTKETTLKYGEHLMKQFPEELFDHENLAPDRERPKIGGKKN